MSTRIDAHQHFWRLDRGDYAWLRSDVPALQPLYRDFLPGDLHACLRSHDVTQTVLVQAAATEAETEFMLALASAHDWIAGVVGWVDLSQRTAVDSLLNWSRHPKFKGVRPMLQDLPEIDWIAQAPHPEVMRALADLELRFDALVKPHHLESLLQFLHRHPDLPVVIDHAAKPQLSDGWEADWAALWSRDMPAIAAHPNVMCKLSGLLTETAEPRRRSLEESVDSVRRVWDDLLRWFGPERLMWGSDWPVLNRVANFDRWVAVCEVLIADLPETDRARIWHDNACRFYALAPRGADANVVVPPANGVAK